MSTRAGRAVVRVATGVDRVVSRGWGWHRVWDTLTGAPWIRPRTRWVTRAAVVVLSLLAIARGYR